MDLGQVNAYRMLHIDNIPHVLTYGLTHKDSIHSNPNFVSIGDASLISNRCNRQVNVDNGDMVNTIEKIILGEYMPFYFGIKMPMLFVVQRGGNFVEKAVRPDDIVYVVCSVKLIVESNRMFYFSDGHATDSLTTFYTKDSVEVLPQILDWPAIKRSYWGGQDNLNLKRKKQAEFLVKGDVPLNCIIGYGCYSSASKQRLIEFGIHEQLIKIIPQAYY